MRLAWALVFMLLAVTQPLAAKLTLTGEVTYRERVALPPGASLRLQLVDLSLPAAPPRLDVSAPIGEGQVPLSFSLELDDSFALTGHNYGLVGTISAGNAILFRNFEPAPVGFGEAAQPISIVTQALQQPQAPTNAAETSTRAPPQLLEVTWKVATINGAAVLPRSSPTLTIATDYRAGGSAGCNSWFAEARIDGDRLRFGSITSTQKGCTQSVNLQEQAFKDALAATTTWKVDGDRLSLFAADGKLLLELHS